MPQVSPFCGISFYKDKEMEAFLQRIIFSLYCFLTCATLISETLGVQRGALNVNIPVDGCHKEGRSHDIAQGHGHQIGDEEVVPPVVPIRLTVETLAVYKAATAVGSLATKMPRGMKNMLATLCSKPVVTKAIMENQIAKILRMVSSALKASHMARQTSQFHRCGDAFGASCGYGCLGYLCWDLESHDIKPPYGSSFSAVTIAGLTSLKAGRMGR